MKEFAAWRQRNGYAGNGAKVSDKVCQPCMPRRTIVKRKVKREVVVKQGPGGKEGVRKTSFLGRSEASRRRAKVPDRGKAATAITEKKRVEKKGAVWWRCEVEGCNFIVSDGDDTYRCQKKFLHQRRHEVHGDNQKGYSTLLRNPASRRKGRGRGTQRSLSARAPQQSILHC